MSIDISSLYQSVQWFTNDLNEPAFLFNVHVIGINPENSNPAGRVYVDPMGEKVSGGLIKAKKLGHGEAVRLYG